MTLTAVPSHQQLPTEFLLRPPPLLLGAVLCFWGWQTDLLFLSLGMALLLESSHWVRVRWEFSDQDFNRLADLTLVLWVGAAFYWFNRESVAGLFSLLIWSPLLMFLLVLGQCYSTAGSLRLSSLFMSLRREQQALDMPAGYIVPSQQRLNISYPYLVLCLLSTSVIQHPSFFYGLCAALAWGLWPLRPRAYSGAFWVLLMGLAIGLGYAGQLGIYRLQGEIESWVLSWFEYQLWQDRDPYQQRTTIGDIGERKLSNRILLRVKAPSPLLLRQASYDHYVGNSWRARQVKFEDLPQTAQAQWSLAKLRHYQHAHRLQVASYLEHGRGMLPLPLGAYQLHAPETLNVSRNLFDGAVKITDAPGLLNYRVDYLEPGLPPALNPPATLAAQELPVAEALLLHGLAEQLGLLQPTLSAQQKIQRVSAFFAENFRYSLIQRDAAQDITPLARFLTETRTGHCEYFATATALLLRAAGIPTRYASGYAVEEYSFLEDAYLVRQRHAHAWALALVDGQWQEVDTTPATWAAMETAQADWWEPVYDLLAWARYLLARWQWQDKSGSHDWLLWLLLPLGLLLVWRLAVHRRRHPADTAPVTVIPKRQSEPGHDSPFYRILDYLRQQGYERPAGTPLCTWLQQLAQKQPDLPQPTLLPAPAWAALLPLSQLHNRYRFDPDGLSAPAQTVLRQETQAWLVTYTASLVAAPRLRGKKPAGVGQNG